MRETSKIVHSVSNPESAPHGEPSLALEARFDDMAQYGESVGWDLDFRQLESGELDAGVRAITMAFGMMLNVNFNRMFHQVGCAPGGLLTFGVPDVEVGEFGWCAAQASGGVMVNFNLDSGFEGVSHAGFNGHTFSFHHGALQDFSNDLGFEQPLETLVKQQSFWRTSGTVLLSQRLRGFSDALDQNGPEILQAYSDMVNEEIATCIIECLNSNLEHNGAVSPSEQHAVLTRSMAILNDPSRLPITVAGLCREAATSLSTLKRVFLAEFGVPPKTYIRARCLSAVRDALAHAPPGTRVSDVANQWGFWHMGQFARDYRAMFGELPSDRLARKG